MPKKLSREMRRIVRSADQHLEVQAGPGSGKTTVAIARVRHLLKADPAAKIILLSFSNSAVRNLQARLLDAGVKADAHISVSTCHALAHRLARSSSSAASDEVSGGETHFEAMLRAGIKALKQNKRAIAVDHLLVDEYQDCSRLQSKLIAQLAERAQTTVVLGDRMQSIYGFSKVRYRPLRKLLPGVRELPLSLSHRLTHQLAALANAVAAPMSAPPIRAERNGEPPELIEAADVTTLARWVAKRIQKLIAKGAVPDQIAVLGRNRSTARPVARELRALGINSTLLGQTNGHMEEVLDVIAVLQVVEQANWTQPLRAPCKHSRSAPAGIRALRQQLQVELDDALTQALGEDFAGRRQWASFVAELQKLVEAGTAHPEGRFHACAQAYLRLMGGVRSDKQLQIDLNAWRPVCRQHHTAAALADHARTLMHGAAVTVTNIHQAKGLEWDHVFVVGVTDGVLPDFRAASQSTMDNERSIFYVAITRARERLWLCHAPVFGQQARRPFEALSCFLTPSKARDLYTVRRIAG